MTRIRTENPNVSRGEEGGTPLCRIRVVHLLSVKSVVIVRSGGYVARDTASAPDRRGPSFSTSNASIVSPPAASARRKSAS